jgi:hypothetical protein
MGLQAASYLATLAMVATTFVGFAALLVGLRQAKGNRLTRYDAYFTLSYIELGFLVTVASLIPPLVSLFGWPANVVWRVSSFLSAIPILLFVVTVPPRRRAATGLPVPRFIKVVLTIQGSCGLALLTSAVINVRQPSAIYATAVTVVLVGAGVAYLFALQVIRPEIGGRRD